MRNKMSRREALGHMARSAALMVPSGQGLSLEEEFVPFVLSVFASGGWDQTMVFDPKVGIDSVVQEAGSIYTLSASDMPFVHNANRPAVKSFFDNYGANCAIVNGLHAGSMSRSKAIDNIWGAVPLLGTEKDPKGRPVDWWTYYTANLNPVLHIPHAVIDAPYMPGDFPTIAYRLTTKAIQEYSKVIPNTKSLGANGEIALAAMRDAALNERMNSINPASLDFDKLRALQGGLVKETTIAADLSAITSDLGSQGSESDFQRNGKIAIELFARGFSQAATVQAGAFDLWDTYSNNFSLQAQNYQTLFTDLNAILAYAQEKEVASKLVLLVFSERGRAPTLNVNSGKSPWPFTSALLWGVGIKGGTVCGLTDDYLRGTLLNPLFGSAIGEGDVLIELANVVSALYLQMGIPYERITVDYPPLSPILALEA
jgi:hypothetical protein